MQTEDLRHIIEWEALDVGEIALGSKKAEIEGLGLLSSLPSQGRPSRFTFLLFLELKWSL